MGIKAFDKELNCEVFAKNAIPKSKGVYCCPEKECISANVPIYLCQKKNGNCFVSYNAAMHKGCDFVSSFDKKYHNIQIPDLSLDKLYNSLNENVVMKNQNKNSKYKEGNFKSKEKETVVTEINSIYQLYRYFSSNEPTFIFSPGTMIQDVFIDTGTSQKWYADRQTIENKLLLFCALLSWGAMVLSPHYPDRATFGTMVLIICVVLSLARDILKERKDLSPWLWGVTLLIWLRGMYYLGEFLALSWGWIR